MFWNSTKTKHKTTSAKKKANRDRLLFDFDGNEFGQFAEMLVWLGRGISTEIRGCERVPVPVRASFQK